MKNDALRTGAICRDEADKKAICRILAEVNVLKQDMKNKRAIERIRDEADKMLQRLQDERRAVH